ncbi:MAG TPA: sugar phosphate isomerase/epimerase [Chthoniobacteraceae bacterium]|jgi:sugar phosphate isomerase/epimerase|nr:sugar phosphate isomerase/epimerase [Chthoniobacteraceae bacterium]
MKISQVAAQLYTCRDTLTDAAGVAKTLRRLRETGYTAVQLSGLGQEVAYSDFIRMCADTGLVCCATHESSNVILNTPEKVIENLNILDCKLTAYPFPTDIDLSSRKSVDAMIAKLQHAAEVLAGAGQTLCYHNHNHEFRKLDGKTILDLIYDGAPAIQGEPDTYWIQYGGGDNRAWCRKLHGRLPMIHLKDYETTASNTPAFCEIGAGVLDFKSIIADAEAAGCQWFIVEQDTCPGDPVDSLAQSFRYIQENLLS